MTDLQTQIMMDIGRKCGADVSAAIRRNMALVEGPRACVTVAAYAAASAVGSTTGAMAILLGQDPEPNPEFVDRVWAEFIRPMILGEFSAEAAHG